MTTALGALAALGTPATVLDGGPAPGAGATLAEIVRPYQVAHRGITFVSPGEARRVSYRELAEWAAGAALRLRRAGVVPGARVATTIGNDLASVVAVLGVWVAGAAVVSVPPTGGRGADLQQRHFDALLRAAGCEFALADPDDAGPFTAAGLRVVGRELEVGRVDGDPALAPQQTALVQFTSGSVSAPKGVAVGAGQLARHLNMIQHDLRIDAEQDTFVSWLPLYHDMGLLTMLLSALTARADLVLMPPSMFAFGPARWLATLAEYRGTITAAPNFAYRMAATVPCAPGTDLSRVRLSLCGGERLSWQTLQDFHAATEWTGFPWGALLPCYGLAEGIVGTTRNPLGRGPVRGPDGLVSVGRPVSGARLRAPGPRQPGPIEMAGEWVFQGYHTADGFTATAPGWFDTGDRGYVHDGELYVIGRRGEVVAAGGRNIFAEDIEAAVHDGDTEGVRACAAFRLADEDQNFGLMVEVAPRPTRTPAEYAALAGHIRAEVSAAVGIRVQRLLLVRAGGIPRTTSGKVRRAQCRSLLAEGSLGNRLLTDLN